MTTATEAPEVRVFHRPTGWVLPDYTDLADCTTNYHRQQDGRPLCTATAVWKVVEDHGMHLTIGFYCDTDLPAEHRPPRTNTPDRINSPTSRTITVQRACNGCGTLLGDVTNDEINRAVAGQPPADVRSECDHCRPLVELEAQGCKTWQLTPRSYARIDHQLDRLDVFTKQFTKSIDGKVTTVGMRIGEKPGHVVAYFGDTIIRHPDGHFTTHKAPESATAA